MTEQNSKLVWIDLEMTGLDPEKERIIEMATIITDSELNTVAEGPVIAINQPTSLLDAMDEWCTNTHGASGLTQRVKESNVTEAEAEQLTLEFLKEHLSAGESPLCGNSIGQDRRFLVKYMPELEAFFHYRNLDVSTIKELARRWRPDVLDGVKKKGSHLALDDIRDSINELRHYRETFFKL
ncbi:oligoribonuclease [Marinobacter persicus]|uniref:Oligoribonuclease n=1 Tax=Marinobacter persicus TaxID=930118 RepID=A0A1I3PSS0_9GAMM|nr:oligoribonuclease [Marinobacter persicus]GHD53516.1 oligoribonuclease [Marinobacter persicus]SFJ24539.1 oligoribonuclease [Marinobacter persicus]